MKDDIEMFLQETKFCDFNNHEIQKLSREITKNYSNEKDKTITLFYWVRDNILYRVGLWRKTASETLREGEGTCTNKSNLFVAFLRSIGIRAGYGVMKVYGRRYFGPIATPMLKKFVGERSTHVYTLVYLDNKWLRCDPSADKELCESTSYFNPTTKLVEWDGIEDAPLNLDEKDIISDDFPLANIDEWFIKKPRHAKGLPLKIANIYIKFARKNREKVANASELESLFKTWLRINRPLYFYLFSILSFYQDLKLKIVKNGKNS